MNSRSRIWAVALLVGVLAVGGSVGAAADRFVFGGPADCSRADERKGDHRAYVDRLAGELALTADQRAEVEAIIERHRQRMSSLWRETRPRFEEMKTQLRAEIAGVLTSEQQVMYRDILERHRRAHEERKRSKK